MGEVKRCNTCGKTKSINDFGRGPSYVDGIRPKCKQCLNDYGRSYRAKNLEVVRAKERERELQPERRQQVKTNHSKYYLNNIEKITENAKKWRAANPDRVRNNGRIDASNRRARIRGNGGRITQKEWESLCERYGNKCLRCGKQEVTLDHVIPISLDGLNTIENAQPLCGSCNSGKKDKIIDYRSLFCG